MSVYPDSDKVSGPEGILLRGSAVGYWHGEGTHGPAAPDGAAHEPECGELLDVAVVDLEAEPYHYVYGREQWVLVLAGAPTLRHPQGEEQLEAGDLVCLPEGPAGAREWLDRGGPPVRALVLSTTGVPANVCYPDARRWVLLHGPGEAEVTLPYSPPAWT
jgi:hypothetical protein